ncbi:MAG: thiamine phosphate synthase [Thermoflexales bacterium]|nr:thiamine phosphate synthase [Thermoflexales bacterium]
MKQLIDWSLYLVTDRELAGGCSIIDIVMAAVAGGVTAVQLRDKAASTREMIELGQALLAITRPAGVPLIVNDRLDVALAVEADGVHVGQDDMPASIARRLIGPDKILGVTASNSQEARQAVADGADYLGCNAVFWTPTKTDTGQPVGVEGFRDLVRAVPLPVVAIGGIKLDNAGDLIRAGAAGVAVVSAIVAAPDPQSAARALRAAVEAARANLKP